MRYDDMSDEEIFCRNILIYQVLLKEKVLFDFFFIR